MIRLTRRIRIFEKNFRICIVSILAVPLAVVFGLTGCSGTRDLVLDDPAFLRDMVNGALEGQTFRITPEDHPGIRDLMNSDLPDYRSAAAALAAGSGDDRLVDMVIQGALDSDPDVVEFSLDFIRSDPEAYRPFLLSMLESGNPGDRIGALDVLAASGGEDLVPVFIRFFDHPDEDVRNHASLAIRRVAGRNNPFLREALSMADALGASTAYRTLGRYEHPDDIPVFIDAFSSDTPEIRREAQLAVLKNGEAALPFLHIEAADDSASYRSRLAALTVIQGLRLPESLGLLTDLLLDADEGIRSRSATILENYGTEAAEHFERIFRESESAAVRVLMAVYLGNLGTAFSLPALADGLDDVEESVRSAAEDALRLFGNEARTVLRGKVLGGGRYSVEMSLSMLMTSGDVWLYSAEGLINGPALNQVLARSSSESLAAYLDLVEIPALQAETVELLHENRRLFDRLAVLERDIAEGRNEFLSVWYSRQRLSMEFRDTLRRSFDSQRSFFENGDNTALENARTVRAESRRLEKEMAFYERTLETMDPRIVAEGRDILDEYLGIRRVLVDIWEHSAPELRDYTASVFSSRGLEPERLSQETILFETFFAE